MQENYQTIKKPGKKPKAKISLLTLLANTKTADARRLLKKYGQTDAKDYNDLALKLAELYQSSSEKVAIEKEFAEMHPHKALILRNLVPKPLPIEEKANFTQEETDNLHRQFIGKDGYSNCSGNSNLSNACGCGSHFDGNNPTTKEPMHQIKDWIGPTMLVFVMGTMAYIILSLNKANNK
jgi:hypothetical protein